ncbi:MAG: hypothetical protein A2521_13975 [Deltaproteobacteria bacterium RIFOXYD12_FULL_57_12]|nr:MAG: hypothetical protein A2521_13975 [Deltaproteobacteria bacterium RIFOXYD12_FULL_57_12]
MTDLTNTPGGLISLSLFVLAYGRVDVPFMDEPGNYVKVRLCSSQGRKWRPHFRRRRRKAASMPRCDFPGG